MNSFGSGLPADVIAALHEGRKIDAIKLLREQRGIGLKEAKQEVDAYLRDHPQLAAMQKTGSPAGCFLVVAIIAAVGYMIAVQIAQ